MTFEELLDAALAMLRRRGRVSYRAFKRQFDLDDDYLEDLKEAILYSHPQVADEQGRGLVWLDASGITGQTAATSSRTPEQPDTQDVTPTQGAPTPAETHAHEAERRQLTVMFSDLVGSTELSGQWDPEDYRDILRAYQTTCAEVIRRFDGYIAQHLGDALLVYFGYPQAHEDEAQRAIHTALGMLEAIEALNARLRKEREISIAIRIGIHTGLTVIGDVGEGTKHELLALGEAPNIASRIQGIATPGTIAISADTHRLVQGYFDSEDLGFHALKGVVMPVQVYRVLAASGVKSRFEVASIKGLTPLVGRAEEVNLLLKRWAQTKDGLGQVILLCGEAGIGKSRLLQILRKHVEGEPHTVLVCPCFPYYQNTALYPVTALLERTLRFQRGDSVAERFTRMEEALAHYRLTLAETVPLFAELLSLPLPPDRYRPLPVTSQRQKQKTLEAILSILLELAERQPVLLIFEDLHWIDPSTQELLSLLVDQVPTARICAIFAFRPVFVPPWGNRSHLTQINLGRLSHTQVADMIEGVADGKTLPAEVCQQIVSQTDGVPLFVEEVTKVVLESGLLTAHQGRYELLAPLPALTIPATLQDSLMARLDRLGSVKGVVQLGAVIGRQFSYELLQALSSLNEAALQEEIERLVTAELLYQRGVPPRATYVFKHALLQEAAYQSLLKSTRRQYHEQIAQVLTERFSETRDTQPELLAHHYTEAGRSKAAIGYWLRAGQLAIERSAHMEAIAHLSKGQELLADLADLPERLQYDLTLQLTLGVSLTATRGYGAPEVESLYARARQLGDQMPDNPRRIPVLFGLWRFYFQRADLRAARDIGEQLLRLSLGSRDPVRLLSIHTTMGVTLFSLGELASARAHLEQGLAFHAPQTHQPRPTVQDPAVTCQMYAGLVLWFCGYPDQALHMCQQSLTLAQRLGHPHSQGFALIMLAALHQIRQEAPAAQEQAEAAIALATEQGFPLWAAGGTIWRGWALAAQGRAAEGIDHIIQGLTIWQATGAEQGRALFLALLAEAYGKSGRPEAGLEVLTEALTLVNKTGECYWQAEIYRLTGDLLLQSGRGSPGPEAEAHFHQAMAMARQQQAKVLELRAAISLGQHWRAQGKPDAARRLLEATYAWFSEGFETADLKKAQALIEITG